MLSAGCGYVLFQFCLLRPTSVTLAMLGGRGLLRCHPQPEEILAVRLLTLDTCPLSILQRRTQHALALARPTMEPVSVREMRLRKLFVTAVAPPSLHLSFASRSRACVALPFVVVKIPHSA